MRTRFPTNDDGEGGRWQHQRQRRGVTGATGVGETGFGEVGEVGGESGLSVGAPANTLDSFYES
jgi:hypothetical protein